MTADNRSGVVDLLVIFGITGDLAPQEVDADASGCPHGSLATVSKIAESSSACRP